MKSFNRMASIALFASSMAGCANADKLVLVVGTISPPLRNCAAYVSRPSQVFDKRDVNGKYLLRYLVGSSDAWIDVEIRCGTESKFKQRFSPVSGTIDVGDL